MPRLPTAFLPHGGGPWPVQAMSMLAEEERLPLLAFLQSLPALAPSAKALLVASAHWEEAVPTVTSASDPGMLFDYYGFPPEAYTLRWPASGDPALAARVMELLQGAGIGAAADAERAYDHGVYVPLLPGWPTPGLPVVQLSLQRSLDPSLHLAMGRALAPLRDEGVLILGSGNSFHDIGSLMGRKPQAGVHAERFDAWLAAAVALPPEERDARLRAWSNAPSARECHPREEHLLPLHVVAGAAGEDRGRVAWRGTMGGMALSAHVFG